MKAKNEKHPNSNGTAKKPATPKSPNGGKNLAACKVCPRRIGAKSSLLRRHAINGANFKPLRRRPPCMCFGLEPPSSF